MSFSSKVLRQSSGFSLPFVIVTTSVIISAIAYLVITLLPRLQGESTKIKDFVKYRIFITSLNDYVVHALRERWCLKSLGTTNESRSGVSQKIVLSDLLLTDSACRSTDGMESIVTYEGNLERILWDSSVIGSDPPGVAPKNTIIGINQARRTTLVPPPVQLLANQVGVKGIYLRLTEEILNDMSSEHPLYLITKDVTKCIESVDVNIEQVQDINGLPVGSEKKLKVEIIAKIVSPFIRFSCALLKDVRSTSYYTFFPRSLTTFSLIKYGDLAASFRHDYHSPVYVAGNLKLPPTDYPKEQSSIFYDSLTLGYQTSLITGKIKQSNGEDYTYAEKGDPLLSKQSEYPGFRGLLNGVRLDGQEDKGFYNLFDHTALAGSGVAQLEACIEESKILTNPSMTVGSQLAYVLPVNSQDEARLRFGLSKKNRFKKSITAPAKLSAPTGVSEIFGLKVLPEPMSGQIKSIGQIKFTDGAGRDYSASIGPGASVELSIDLTKIAMRPQDLQLLIDATSSASKDSFQNAIPNEHLLSRLSERDNFVNATQSLNSRCQTNPSSDCTALGYAVTCDKALIPACDYNLERLAFEGARQALVNKLGQVKNEAAASGDAKLTISMASLPLNADGKATLNQIDLNLVVNTKWKNLIPHLQNSARLTFTPDHYAPHSGDLAMTLDLKSSGPLVDLTTTSSWRKVADSSAWSGSLNPDVVIELNCPEGIGLADWDLDMSGSARFSWNYANTSAGVEVAAVDHSPIPEIVFNNTPPLEGHANSYSKSIVNKCIIPKERTDVYGFYVCEILEIEAGRTSPLNMIGTFIVKEIRNPNLATTVNWYNVWHGRSAEKIFTDLKSGCSGLDLAKITWETFMKSSIDATRALNCSALDLVSNGPNNFTWSTVDPDIGLATPSDVMTSQKVKRVTRWVVREDSRRDVIR